MTPGDTGRREVLEYVAGVSSVLGSAALAGCSMVEGSQESSMGFMQDVDALQMFQGAPAHGEFPAEPMEMEMHGGMTMEALPVKMIAKPDDSNNYHFMPHVAWVEPETTVVWSHADIDTVSEPRSHTVTSFGGGNLLPRMIPEEAEHFDSGFIAGLHGQKSEKHGIDERYNGRMSDRLLEAGNPLGRGPFTHTFHEEGVYLYYCQNHHEFKMAAAVVVGELWGEGGTEAISDAHGWSPAMTRETDEISQADELHGAAVQEQVHELREMIHSGGEMMGGH